MNGSKMMIMTLLIGVSPVACIMLISLFPEKYNEWLLKNKHYVLYFIFSVIAFILFIFTQGVI